MAARCLLPEGIDHETCYCSSQTRPTSCMSLTTSGSSSCHAESMLTCAGRQRHTAARHRASCGAGQQRPACSCPHTPTWRSNQRGPLHPPRIGNPVCSVAPVKPDSKVSGMYCMTGHPMWLHDACCQRG